jgi:hypothetical protein
LVVGEGEVSDHHDDHETMLPWLCPVAVDAARRRLMFSDEGWASWKVVGGGGEEGLNECWSFQAPQQRARVHELSP